MADVSTAIEANRRAAAPDRFAALTIVSHPTARRVGERCVLEGLAGGREVALSRNGPDFVRPGSALGAPLDDPFVSRTPIRFAPIAGGGIRLIAGGTPVTADAPITGELELAPEAVAAGVPLVLADRVVVLLHLVDRAAGEPASLGMLGDSAAIRRVRAAIERVVDLDTGVLIRGETGTGKELVARAIHDRSPRRAAPFVSVNLGAVSRDLAASELFGAMRGAYTGATRDRDGLFRAAHGGTLFLDELGEAGPELQGMLLRAIETGEVYPVGADRPIAIDVRLIAATDADLEDRIRDGAFKAPLLHRLAGYEIRIPPLRERREDLGLLFHHFAREELAAIGELDRLAPTDPYAKPWLPAALAARLVRFAWPGNIRQLRNVARQLVIGSRGLPQLQIDPALDALLGAAPQPEPARRRKPSDIAEAELLAALRDCAWDLPAAAARLGIPRPSIYDLIDKLPDIRTAGELDPGEIARSYQSCAGDLDAMVAQLRISKRALRRRLKELGLAT